MLINRLFAIFTLIFTIALSSYAPAAFAQNKAKALSGTLSGSEVRDYPFDAKAGEKMRFTLSGDENVYLLIWQTGEEAGLLTTDIRDWMGAIPEEGHYIARVYLFKPAAEAGKTGRYRLSIKRYPTEK